MKKPHLFCLQNVAMFGDDFFAYTIIQIIFEFKKKYLFTFE